MEFHVEFRHKSYTFLKSATQNENVGGYTCLVKKIEIINSNSNRISIIGQHQGNEQNVQVVGFSIRNATNMDKFPREIGKIFPNLKYFEIDGSSIKMLSREDLGYLGHLQGFWMPRNPIVTLMSDLFLNVQGLRFVSFHQNKLKYIGADILLPLKNLVRANFRENTTIDSTYDNGGEEKLAALNKEIAIKCVALRPDNCNALA